MTNYANMPNVKPPQFSLDGEMERLRVEIRDRDFEIITLRAQIKKMKCCDNCKHYGDIGEFSPEHVCHIIKDKCTVEAYEAWEPRE